MRGNRVADCTLVPGIASDDSDYMNNAAQLAVGKPPLAANQHSVRLGYEVFLAAGMRIFGQNTKVCQALGLGVFAVTALLLFLLAGMLSGARTAMLAVFLYVFLPLDMLLSTNALPDGVMTLLALAASLLYLQAKKTRPASADPVWRLVRGCCSARPRPSKSRRPSLE